MSVAGLMPYADAYKPSSCTRIFASFFVFTILQMIPLGRKGAGIVSR